MSESYYEHLPAPAHVNQITDSILDDFNKITRRPDDPAKSFICYYDLERIWTAERVRGLLSPINPRDLPNDLLLVVRQKMFTILSILVTIGAFACRIDFLTRLFTSGRPRFTDDCLPLELQKIDFLDGWQPFKEQFSHVQHKFCPVKIQQRHEEIDPSWRLPFETIIPSLGSGAFGDVELIGIPGGYFVNEDGSEFSKPFQVACKKFRVYRDFYSEADTLQILKESLVSQTHILKHLATIKHGPDCYILLPYASHGDLYQFLRCGRPLDDEPPPYNFGQKFPLISKTPEIAGPLLKQCWALANAVNWLHDGITIESNTNSSKVFCIHMDLKPDNILIQQDNQSIVGKWMISDFGISVTKEKRRENNPNIISIRDWYNKLTSVNTRPRRNVGTYQAPEVVSAENNQRGVGSRLDIWSYGCIFSEILAFAIGRDKEVERFNSERNNGKDNYFFDHGLLGGKARVRQSVTDWLNARRDSSNSANKWERCWAETIKEILVIEPNERPNGKQLQKLIEHVKSHESMSAQEASKQTCHNLVRTPPQSPKEIKPSGPGPIITVSSPPGMPAPFHLPNPPESGIFINARRKQDPQAHRHSPGGAAIDVALSHHDKKTRAAFLTKETVQVYDLDLNTYKVTPCKEYTVTSRLKNAHITLSGPFLAVWGFCEQRKKKMLYFCDVEKEGDNLENTMSEDLGLLDSVAISPQGVVALVCRTEIFIKNAQSIVSNRSSGAPEKLYPTNGQIFAHAAFNDIGKFLFAWAYDSDGKSLLPVESLHVWKVYDRFVKHFEARYPSEERETSHTKVIPYNMGMGCVIAAPEQRVFPVQTSENMNKLGRRQEHELKNLETGCVFQDYSFIALRRKGVWPLQKWFLKEYQIGNQSQGKSLHKGEKLCDLKSKPGTASQMRIVRVSEEPESKESESKLVAVICNLDGVELVPFVPIK